ncbi:hypothetical protein [Streptomyces sp. NPDC017991]|uniref:hypothetical protein n=1 Tax=Streptomyces sp. NPDC017991 TaxID=3365026 RepID=UPI0037B268A9
MRVKPVPPLAPEVDVWSAGTSSTGKAVWRRWEALQALDEPGGLVRPYVRDYLASGEPV